MTSSRAIADRAARLYELVFAPQDQGWLYVVMEAQATAVLPDPLTLTTADRSGPRSVPKRNDTAAGSRKSS